VWKPVVGYEGRYEVSDRGRVRSLCSRHGPRRTPRILAAAENTWGYPFVGLSACGVRKLVPIHVIVAAAFYGPRPAGMDINHLDGKKTNNRPSNLTYCSKSDNLKHAYRTGLKSNVGERHSQAKHTEQDVRDVRAYLRQECRHKDIAAFMRVPVHFVSGVSAGCIWAHVV